MGAKQSTNTRMRTFSNGGGATARNNGGVAMSSPGPNQIHGHVPGASGLHPRIGNRTRSLGSVQGPQPLSIPSNGAYSAPDSENSTPDDGRLFPMGAAQSLPVQLIAPSLLSEDVLAADAGECVICFEDLSQGDTIARLPCLCIYHKGCIDKWFEVNRSCPEHPGD
ncbi:E3 ubiquitin-protein ligase znrf2-like isoform X2 [Branchiostoma floridae]|uniref:E3 ubiquitin-protein ligase ZNRF1 n=1 Tax=Branchiostoma floridae TaxID=7739 RepID=A0A9J7LE98_BRAFL|nr:E3 ubiquitin-protein ligase znrf2-like isoform X2 [Branchiostoma floridae]